MENKPVIHETHALEVRVQQMQLLKATLCKDLSNDEFQLFWNIADRTKLDPLRRQIYAIRRQGRMTIQTGIDGYRAIASRNPNYAGQEGPYWCGRDGVWHDHWVQDEPPVACKVGIRRKDWQLPTYATANLKSFAVQSNPLWKSMPEHMIAVRAEALALRKAFPEDLSDIRTEEEMDNPVQHARPVETVKVKTLTAAPVAPVAPPPAPQIATQVFPEHEIYTGAQHQKAFINMCMDKMSINKESKTEASQYLINTGVYMNEQDITNALAAYLGLDVEEAEAPTPQDL